MTAHGASAQDPGLNPGSRPSRRVHTPPSQGSNIVGILRQVLGDIAGGRVLDVATGEGSFVGVLIENLKNYTDITGIDASGRAIETARSTFSQENVHFMQMDAEHLDFEDQSFDTVNISASLHHLANVPQVLAEMKRVLKPGGHLIITEMLRDGQTDPQLTAVRIHHWAAEVDSALGVIHNKTLARQELVELVKGLSLCNVEFYDVVDTDSDPMDEAMVKQVKGYMDRFVQRAGGLPNYKTLKQRGEELCQRLHEVGGQREPVIIIVGKKQ